MSMDFSPDSLHKFIMSGWINLRQTYGKLLYSNIFNEVRKLFHWISDIVIKLVFDLFWKLNSIKFFFAAKNTEKS